MRKDFLKKLVACSIAVIMSSAVVTYAISPDKVKAAHTEIHIGEGAESNTGYLPCYYLYRYSVTQQIYTSDEIGNVGGTIQSVSFQVMSTSSSNNTRSINLYLMDTDKTSFADANGWLDFNDAQLCYSGNYEFTVGWNQIDLTTAFDHDSTKNLAVLCLDSTGNWWGNGCKFSVFSAEGQAMYQYNDDSPYNISALPAAGGISADYKNEIIFCIDYSDVEVTAEGFDGAYDGEAHGIVVSVTDPATGATVKYGETEGTYDLDESPAYTEAGTYTVYYQVSADGYSTVTGSATVTISKTDPDYITEPVANELTYNGEAQELVTAGVPSFGTILYSLDGVDFDVAIPTQTEVGSYDVYYMIEGDESHNDSPVKKVTATISEPEEEESEEEVVEEPVLTPEQIQELAVRHFVERLYLNALERPFDVAGRDSFVDLIMHQNGTGSDVVRCFLGSAEFANRNLNNEEFVNVLYKAFFNRVPTAAEAANWTNALASGMTRAEIIEAFIASPEWAEVCAYYKINI